MNINRKYKLSIMTLIIVFLVISIGTSFGSSNINIIDIFKIIISKTTSLNLAEGIDKSEISIIWNIRFPRVILAFIVGGALAVSGAVVQSILKNPLASPYTLGITSGASLGVGIIIITGISIPILGNYTLSVTGFIFSLITMIIILKISQKLDKYLSNNTIILMGMVISLFLNSLLTTFSALYSKKIEAISRWQMGSFSLKGWSYLKMGLPFIIMAIIWLMFYLREMDIMTFGEEDAKALGVETEKTKYKLFIIVSILTGTAVSMSGIIGFIDLIAPHVARKLFGARHKFVIPVSFIFGGVMMVITDLVARIVIQPAELPVGAVTALIGAPVFAYIYFNKRGKL